MQLNETKIYFFPCYNYRSSPSALVSCHIHSTQSDDEWWCSLDVQRKILCTRTHWIAGLRFQNKKVHVPSSRVHCPMYSVEPVVPSSWYSMTNSRRSLPKYKTLKKPTTKKFNNIVNASILTSRQLRKHFQLQKENNKYFFPHRKYKRKERKFLIDFQVISSVSLKQQNGLIVEKSFKQIISYKNWKKNNNLFEINFVLVCSSWKRTKL